MFGKSAIAKLVLLLVCLSVACSKGGDGNTGGPTGPSKPQPTSGKVYIWSDHQTFNVTAAVLVDEKAVGTVSWFRVGIDNNATCLNPSPQAIVTTLPFGTHSIRAVFSDGRSQYLSSFTNTADCHAVRIAAPAAPSNPQPTTGTLVVVLSAGCSPKVSTADIYIDDSFKAKLTPGSRTTEIVSAGTHKIFSRTNINTTFGPTDVTVNANSTFTFTLNCP